MQWSDKQSVTVTPYKPIEDPYQLSLIMIQYLEYLDKP